MTVIEIEDLWKEYRLGVIGHGTMKEDWQSWWAKVRGKEDPNAKIIPMLKGQEKQIEGDHFWALRGIDLEVKAGDVLGIIGKNGAGKSTLLKILSRVTAPTRGSIKVKGRIASLLEVGTGFHSELTGRENIFLNGAILGMSKQEIRTKLDEIIDFSGIETFIDTPVKRYSSGMYVRLAFAVAAHLEPEILIIDEVLAVGDADFQKKCLGKMGEVSREGRTVLFVSHNMETMRRLCEKCILIESGKIVMQGKGETVITKYLQTQAINILTHYNLDGKGHLNDNFVVTGIQIEDIEGNKRNNLSVGSYWQIRLFFQIKHEIKNMVVALGTVSPLHGPINTTWSEPRDFLPGKYSIVFKEDVVQLTPGDYSLAVGLSIREGGTLFKTIYYREDCGVLRIIDIAENDRLHDISIGMFANQMKIFIEQEL